MTSLSSILPVFVFIVPSLIINIKYSGTSLMWTPKGRTKSVHISEVSTVVKPGYVDTSYRDTRHQILGGYNRWWGHCNFFSNRSSKDSTVALKVAGGA